MCSRGGSAFRSGVGDAAGYRWVPACITWPVRTHRFPIGRPSSPSWRTGLPWFRLGRGHFYVPSQHRQGIARMVRDFVGFAGLSGDDLGPVGSRPGPLQRPVHEDVLRALDDERAKLAHRSELATTIADAGTWTTGADDAGSPPSSGYGWSDVEHWGVWTDGEEARLRIPAPPGRRWRATLVGEGYGRSAEIRIGAGPGRMPPDT